MTSAVAGSRARLVGAVVVASLAVGAMLGHELGRFDPTQPETNLAFVWLAPRFALDRDDPPTEVVALRPEARLFVILAIPDPFTSEPYSVIAYDPVGAVAWQVDGLVPTTAAELGFVVPAAWLSPGDVVLDLHGDGIGDAVIASYAFRIVER